jgi:predicted cupin superfamily sugar epimerase
MSMDVRAAGLIRRFGMTPHPEGGYFREIYRSVSRVRPVDERSERSALTTIYFLLVAGQVSRWHRVASDEVWHYYEGDDLELFTADANFARVDRHLLGRAGDDVSPVHIVPSGIWQAARSTGAYTFGGCTVGPGFEFSDFKMLRDLPVDLAAARKQPEVERFV